MLGWRAGPRTALLASLPLLGGAPGTPRKAPLPPQAGCIDLGTQSATPIPTYHKIKKREHMTGSSGAVQAPGPPAADASSPPRTESSTRWPGLGPPSALRARGRVKGQGDPDGAITAVTPQPRAWASLLGVLPHPLITLSQEPRGILRVETEAQSGPGGMRSHSREVATLRPRAPPSGGPGGKSGPCRV